MKDWKVLFYDRKGPTFTELVKQVLSSTKSGYDQLADKFDHTPFRTPVEILTGLDDYMRLTGPFGNSLDVCCGTGAAMEILLNHTECTVVGLDISQKMMEVGKNNLTRHQYSSKAKFVQGDVMNLPFEHEFDIVTNLGGLGHIRNIDTEKFLTEIYKVLKPGGKFIFVTTYHPSIFSFSFWRAYIFNALMYIRNVIIKPPFIMYYLTFLLPRIKNNLEDIGFEVNIGDGLFPKPFHTFKLVVATKI